MLVSRHTSHDVEKHGSMNSPRFTRLELIGLDGVRTVGSKRLESLDHCVDQSGS